MKCQNDGYIRNLPTYLIWSICQCIVILKLWTWILGIRGFILVQGLCFIQVEGRIKSEVCKYILNVKTKSRFRTILPFWVDGHRREADPNWQRAHALWCLSIMNRLECFVTVVKRWTRLQQSNFFISGRHQRACARWQLEINSTNVLCSSLSTWQQGF